VLDIAVETEHRLAFGGGGEVNPGGEHPMVAEVGHPGRGGQEEQQVICEGNIVALEEAGMRSCVEEGEQVSSFSLNALIM
jgi:hypothetical protein